MSPPFRPRVAEVTAAVSTKRGYYVYVTEACNLRCSYCFVKEKTNQRHFLALLRNVSCRSLSRTLPPSKECMCTSLAESHCFAPRRSIIWQVTFADGQLTPDLCTWRAW